MVCKSVRKKQEGNLARAEDGFCNEDGAAQRVEFSDSMARGGSPNHPHTQFA